MRESVISGFKFKPTVQWISENYAKANEELFDGELGDCIFKAEPIKSNTHCNENKYLFIHLIVYDSFWIVCR